MREVEADIYWVAINVADQVGIAKSRLINIGTCSQFEIRYDDDRYFLNFTDFCEECGIVEVNGPFDRENAIEFYESIKGHFGWAPYHTEE